MKGANEKKALELFAKGSELMNVLLEVPEELKGLSDELEKVIEDEAASGTESEDELNEIRDGVKKMRRLGELLGQIFLKP